MDILNFADNKIQEQILLVGIEIYAMKNNEI